MITEYSTQTSGTSATNTDSDTSTVARLLVILRRALTPWKVGALTGRSRVVDVIFAHPSRRPRRGPASSPRTSG